MEKFFSSSSPSQVTMKVPRSFLVFFYPILLFCGIVYLVTMSLSWTGFFELESKDTRMLLGYISIAHVAGIPILMIGIKRKYASYYLFFLIINTVWIILSVVALGLVYGGILGEEARINFKYSGLHQTLYYAYLTVGVIVELIVLVIVCGLQKTIRLVSSGGTEPVVIPMTPGKGQVVTTTTKRTLVPGK